WAVVAPVGLGRSFRRCTAPSPPQSRALCIRRDVGAMVEFENSEIVREWFGCWPSLHDAEVLSINFDRGVGKAGPLITAVVHAFQMTPDVDSKGFYKLIKHCLIQF